MQESFSVSSIGAAVEISYIQICLRFNRKNRFYLCSENRSLCLCSWERLGQPAIIRVLLIRKLAANTFCIWILCFGKIIILWFYNSSSKANLVFKRIEGKIADLGFLLSCVSYSLFTILLTKSCQSKGLTMTCHKNLKTKSIYSRLLNLGALLID